MATLQSDNGGTEESTNSPNSALSPAAALALVDDYIDQLHNPFDEEDEDDFPFAAAHEEVLDNFAYEAMYPDINDPAGMPDESSGEEIATLQLVEADNEEDGIEDEEATYTDPAPAVPVLPSTIQHLSASVWDPSASKDWDQEKPTEQCILRIKRDIMSIYNDPPPGMFIVPDKDDMTILHALITGPFDTPYEGGFFYFFIRCPPDYPIRPPRLRLMSTGGGKVRFNPNLYKNGKVCLSILGTWSGPAWSPALSLSSLLMSIQSLMNEKPYHNEPGFERERAAGDAQRYNDIIRHETLRVAVCEMLEGLTPCPSSLREVMEKSFLECYSHYESVCQSYKHLDGKPMLDPFGERRVVYDYAAITRRLEILKVKMLAQQEARGLNGAHSDIDSDDTESEDVNE